MTKRNEQEIVQLLFLFAKETAGTKISRAAWAFAYQLQDYFERKAEKS